MHSSSTKLALVLVPLCLALLGLIIMGMMGFTARRSQSITSVVSREVMEAERLKHPRLGQSGNKVSARLMLNTVIPARDGTMVLILKDGRTVPLRYSSKSNQASTDEAMTMLVDVTWDRRERDLVVEDMIGCVVQVYSDIGPPVPSVAPARNVENIGPIPTQPFDSIFDSNPQPGPWKVPQLIQNH